MREITTSLPFDYRTSVSVALTTFNGARFLPSQLFSIATQTLTPLELVACDDGSTDDTVAILHAFAKQASFPVRIFCNERKLGFRANFMQCAQHCKGDLIAFSDQDDVWFPNKLQAQVADFRDSCVMLSCHNAELTNKAGKRIERRLDQYPRDCRLDFRTAGPTLFPRGFTQVIRADLVKWDWLREKSIDIGDPSEIMSHDGWFFFLALLHGVVVYHQEPLVDYRQHGDNASGSVPSKRARFLARFSNRPQDYRRLARVWANRCEMLRCLQEDPALDDNIRWRAQQLLAHYDKSARAAAGRAQFYAIQGPLPRLRLLVKAVLRGDFKSNNPWSFPLEAVVKDAAYIFRTSGR